MWAATAPGVRNVNIVAKLCNCELMLQRIPLVNFRQKGYFEKHQSIWLKINLRETVKKESQLPQNTQTKWSRLHVKFNQYNYKEEIITSCHSFIKFHFKGLLQSAHIKL